MEFQLTKTFTSAKKFKDGKSRNILSYFINGTPLIKMKIPFNSGWSKGYDWTTSFKNDFILDGYLYQTRETSIPGGTKIRSVKFPLSKAALEPFKIPQGTMINCEQKFKPMSKLEIIEYLKKGGITMLNRGESVAEALQFVRGIIKERKGTWREESPDNPDNLYGFYMDREYIKIDDI